MRAIRQLIPAAHCDLSAWPRLDEAVMSEVDREIYSRRKRAVELYAAGASFQRIRELTRISDDEVRRHVKRCVCHSDYELIMGFTALFPGTRILPYERRAPSPLKQWGQGGYAGSFQLLLDTHPEIAELIETLLLKKSKNGFNVHQARISFREIHSLFCQKLRALGLTDSDYPFNTYEVGYRSLCKYCEQIELEASERVMRTRFGEEAARRNGKRSSIPTLIPTLRPYSCMQLDYHKEDAASLFTIKNEYGDELQFVVARWYIGFLVEEKSEAVVGAYVTLEVNPSADSALEVVVSSLTSKNFEGDDPRARYSQDGKCLVIQFFPELQYQSFSMLKVDRAWANSAVDVVNNLIDTFGCAVNFGPVRAWWKRALIERINHLLTQRGLQQLPSTYGSDPQDTKKDNPNAAAFKFQISLDELIAVTYGAIAEYNTGKNEGLQYSSPKTVIKAALDHPESGFFHQPLPINKQDDFLLLMHVEDAFVRGNLEKNVKPYFQMDRWKYTNDKLEQSFHLVGKVITTYTDRRLTRIVYATVKGAGEKLGLMRALAGNDESDLSWRDRKLLHKAGRFNRARDNEAPSTLQASMKRLSQQLKQKKADKRKASKEALALAKLQQQSENVNHKRSPAGASASEKSASNPIPKIPVQQDDPFGLTQIPDFRIEDKG